MGTPLTAGIAGLGWWGRVLVASVQHSSQEIRFVAAASPDRGPAQEDFAARHGLSLVSSLDDLLGDPAVEAIVLATPHSLHVEQIVAAASAGRPVFSEKPLALTLAEARRAVDACASAGVVLGLGNDKRFLPVVRALRGLVESGSLGELVHLEGQYSNDNSSRAVSGAWRALPAETPAGGLTGPGLHVIDGLVALAGEATQAFGQFTRRTDQEHPLDAVSALFTFANGATGLMGSVRGVPDYFRLAAFGTRGWAEVSDFTTLRQALDGTPPATRTFDGTLAAGTLLEAFARAVRGGEPFPVTTGSMLATVAAFEATLAALRDNRPVQVTPVSTPS